MRKVAAKWVLTGALLVAAGSANAWWGGPGWGGPGWGGWGPGWGGPGWGAPAWGPGWGGPGWGGGGPGWGGYPAYGAHPPVAEGFGDFAGEEKRLREEAQTRRNEMMEQMRKAREEWQKERGEPRPRAGE
ncbi:MAG: hypothetical protein ACFCUJ_00500 [Thiotrichales bacterium]